MANTVRYTLSVLVTSALAVRAASQCSSKFLDLRQLPVLEGGTDIYGNAVNMSVANGMTYDLCVETCGRGVFVPVGGKSRQWLTFSQAFSIIPHRCHQCACTSRLVHSLDGPVEFSAACESTGGFASVTKLHKRIYEHRSTVV
ncbi:hypothetical protein DFH09DRAFT_1152966 [Mycena vulgaris]|nr:hypothetical protein DFH09DRAFT_1152966 [Mycena vulgaris]